MKRNAFIALVLFFFLCSCSTDVDLYTDFKDVTVVYGVMDVANDTNYIKIIRAFSGSNEGSFNANDIALIADSSNYPGKLDVRFHEFKEAYGDKTFLPTGREIVLDTTTAHNKQEGPFYSPDQKLYYTTEHLNVNTSREKYKYKLLISKPNDTISSEISLIGGNHFQIVTSKVFFKAEDAGTRKLLFTPDDNDAMYLATMQFNYKEVRQGQDTVYKNVNWSFGPYSSFDLGYEEGRLYFTYREDILFTLLENAIGDDFYVERFFDSFVITIFAYGKELGEYIQISEAATGIDYYYTNIHGGLGILSSSHEISKTVDISSRTMTDLLSKHWGFKHLGY